MKAIVGISILVHVAGILLPVVNNDTNFLCNLSMRYTTISNKFGFCITTHSMYVGYGNDSIIESIINHDYNDGHCEISSQWQHGDSPTSK